MEASKVIKAGNNVIFSITGSSSYRNSHKGFPLVLSISGGVSWPITDYLLHRRVKLGRSIGTVKDDANSLALFLTFIENNGLSFFTVKDGSLVGFRDYLLNHHKKGKNSQINKHLNRSINFLLWFDNKLRRQKPQSPRIISLCTDQNYIKANIEIYIEQYSSSSKTRFSGTEVRHHECFLRNSIPDNRHPIPSDTLDRVWEALPSVCKSLARRQRNEVTLLLFEFLGARRTEIFDLEIDVCFDALETGQLILHTAKHQHDEQRPIDLPQEVLNRLEQYLKFVRRPIVKKAILDGVLNKDHRKLLITVRGKPWKEKSFNKELDILARSAGINTPVSPHLFRHRYFSLLTTQIRDLDQKKQLLILKKRGGWHSDESPNTYIDIDAMTDSDVQSALSMSLNHSQVQAIRKSALSKLEEIKGNAESPQLVIKGVESLQTLIKGLMS